MLHPLHFEHRIQETVQIQGVSKLFSLAVGVLPLLGVLLLDKFTVDYMERKGFMPVITQRFCDLVVEVLRAEDIIQTSYDTLLEHLEGALWG